MLKKKFKNSFKRCFNLATVAASSSSNSLNANNSLINNNNNNNSLLTNDLINNQNSGNNNSSTKRTSCCCVKCCFKNSLFYSQTRYNLNYFLKIKLKSCAISLSTILLYYLFSISLTFYNRMLFVTYKYPLSITIIHLIIKFLLSMLLRKCFYMCTSQPRIILNWNLYAKRIIPTGIASALDIGLSNWR